MNREENAGSFADDDRASVDVVVPTHQRADYLRSALDHLVAQRGVAGTIIVVDDASNDETWSVLTAEQERHQGCLRAVRRPDNGGPAAARNTGWRLSAAAWIAFTDDDCEPTAGWVTALCEVALSTGADIVQGRTVPNPSHRRTGCWDRSARIESFSDRYQTCNLLVRRALLEDLGGFDESFGFAGEDADFGWRASAAGARAVFAPDALVHHAIRPQTFRQHLRDRASWAELARFYKHHPEARTMLVGRLFYRPSHLVLLVGTPLVLLTARWTHPAVVPLAGAAYVAARAVRHGDRRESLVRRAVCAAQGVVSSGWEIVQFARASVRHRTVVL